MGLASVIAVGTGPEWAKSGGLERIASWSYLVGSERVVIGVDKEGRHTLT